MISSLLTEQFELLKYFIEIVGTDINVTDDNGVSLIMVVPCRSLVIADEYSTLVMYLIENGADYMQNNIVSSACFNHSNLIFHFFLFV